MRLRDMMASVVVHWNEDMPLCPYVLALYVRPMLDEFGCLLTSGSYCSRI